MIEFPKPHLEKLNATIGNEKIPAGDRDRIEAAIVRYDQWMSDMDIIIEKAGKFKDIESGSKFISEMTALLRAYKFYIDMELIFDSPDDFLYRQKGQLKIDNSIIEEFFPRLVFCFLPEEIESKVVLGPHGCFSSMFFTGNLGQISQNVQLQIRTKDQDFTIGREVNLRASFDANFANSIEEKTYLAYVASEMKTNLDKTMFQEACATAHDVKTAVAGAKYYLICEWLDMTPISTAGTDIDEVLILRGKRLSSNIRQYYSNYDQRRQRRVTYVTFLDTHPFRETIFKRFIGHIMGVLRNENPIENDVIERGYF